MTPMMWLRLAGIAGLLAGLYGGYQYVQHTGVVQGRAEVQKKFDAYKENINDQVKKAKDDAAKTKLEQDTKEAKAKLDYDTARKQLAAALARLRKPEIVPGNGSVPVAGCSSSSMPAKASDTGGTAPAVEVAAGACEGTEFYTLALQDTLQCSRLIEFVKD